MLQTSQRLTVLMLTCASFSVFAQGTPDIPNARVVVVPLGDEVDGGAVEAPPPTPQVEPRGQAADVPPSRTFEASPPPPPPVETAPEVLPPPEQPKDESMVQGHVREGAFLSGPGSFTFIMHHTLMTGLGVLATQMIPRAVDASSPHASVFDQNRIEGCTAETLARTKAASCQDIFSGESARIAYLTGSLVGAAIGFGTSAAWQFFNWQSHRAANFGIISSFFGASFFGAIADLATQAQDPAAITWLTLIGGSVGAWTAAVLGRGDLPLETAAFITTGGVWGAIYTALITAIVATSGTNLSGRTAVDIVMLTPAIGAGLLALASLKFHPSFGQIMRANLFGAAAGALVIVISALIVNPVTGWASPIPYGFGLGASVLAQGLVSWLWADLPGERQATWLTGRRSDGKYVSVW